MRDLNGLVAVVTGASRGIGKGIALRFGTVGMKVVAASRSAEGVACVAREILNDGGEAIGVEADICDVTDVEGLFDRVKEIYGRVDVLVNNAGAFDGGRMDELAVEDFDKVIATNLRGPFLCTQAAIRMMKETGGGRIINIGSISAQRVRPNSAAYSASKFGLWGLTQVTALEGREYGVTCGCVHPGNTFVERRAISNAKEDREPMMEVSEVVEVVMTMAGLDKDVNMLEAIVLPMEQEYVGRG